VGLAKDPATDIDSICAWLRSDGPLVADIIHISNSPYYAPATLHGNLTEAVNQLGLREVIRVINLSLARQLFARDLPGYGITAYDYWSSSVAAALVMEEVAKVSGLNAEDAYAIGILHAIGRVLIDRVIKEKGFSVYWEDDQPIADWERGAVGMDYAEAGAMLLEHWRFPTPTCEVIRWQTNGEKVVEPVSLLGALQFSQRLLALTGQDFENKNWQLPEQDAFLQASKLKPELVLQLVLTCRDHFQKILHSVDWR
jgi:HD-like signal output (HDOD) protein